jgi:hypothetical protein
MHYYDHYHDPNTHLQLTRQRENEWLRAAARRRTRPGLLARLRALLPGAAPTQPASEQVTIPTAARNPRRASSSPGQGLWI